ncbi:Plant protein of unknown function [Forsythia ovata]|uniref:Uncharacterized protein n=1 Tax=Forsythia ovata TaxID=205694 RepID=A0ABD1SPV8_9LAMI
MEDPSVNNSREIDEEALITEDEFSQQDQRYFDGRRMHKVPQSMRFKKHEEDYYAPKMVSFGPYNHGLPKLRMVEEFKPIVLTMFVSRSGKDREFFYNMILEVIDQVRNCYVGVSRDVYNDGALAEMMLLDACFAIYLMKIKLGDTKMYFHFRQHFGMAAWSFVFLDMGLLENQIPLWVIELSINLIYGNKEESMLLWNCLSSYIFGKCRLTRIPGEDKERPLHFLDACHRLLVTEWDNAGKKLVQPVSKCQWFLAGKKIVQPVSKCQWFLAGKKIVQPVSKCQWFLAWPWKKESPHEFGIFNRQFRSVTELKAKGIYFKPSSNCLKDVKFKSYKLFGQIQLPIWFFSDHSKQFFLNMIAYEASPESDVDFPTICYINFLKSLIVKPEDVKELREKKILFSSLDGDEQIVQVIKDIDTCGIDLPPIFNEVKMRIEEHCSNKAKTWIAELFHTYFRNPWTFIALLAATFLLCLTFLQTYYTINKP